MTDQTVAILIPLFLAVMVELCGFSRNDVDLQGAAKEKRISFPLPFSAVPLGRFATIHIVNVFFIFWGIFLVRTVGETFHVTFFGFITLAIFLLMLPVLEVNEYHKIVDSSGYPTSYKFHVLSSLLLPIYTFTGTEIEIWLIDILVREGFTLSGSVVAFINILFYIIPIFVGALTLLFIHLFLVNLRNELLEIES
ncbi:hypothetical protein [Natronobacterium lacisalsi]|uniref:hypothetical protein n=1 Tax=Natronobacterium lacisalsi TaxID=229731 RepID=UPI0012689B31|nr:hypothetical protein [Halobiforma lacisalsi]